MYNRDNSTKTITKWKCTTLSQAMTWTTLSRFHFVRFTLCSYITLTSLKQTSAIDASGSHTAQQSLPVLSQSPATIGWQRNACYSSASYFDVRTQSTFLRGATYDVEATSGDSNRSMGRGDSSIEDYVLVKSESFTQCFSRGREFTCSTARGQMIDSETFIACWLAPGSEGSHPHQKYSTPGSEDSHPHQKYSTPTQV